MYDPTWRGDDGPNRNGWPADYVVSDWDRFVAVYWASQGCFVVIDEAGGIADQLALRRVMQQGRHQGHVNALLSQRHKRIDLTARDQCSDLYTFNVAPSDAEDLSHDWNAPELMQAPQLPPLNYFHKRKLGPCTRGAMKF